MARNQSRKLNEDIPDYWTWLQLQGMDPDEVEDNPDLDEWNRQQYDIMFGFKSPEDFDRDEDLGEEWETADGDIVGRNDVVIYQFPHLSRTDIRKAEEYGLEDVTQAFSDWNPGIDTFLRGELEDLESYGINYIGDYQLVDGYLFDDEGVSCRFVESVAMRPSKKLEESTPVKEAYDPQILKDYIVKYQDSADDMAEIWEDVYNETFDEDLANDVISGLEEIRDGADFNYWNDEWMECLKESAENLDGFEVVGTLYDQKGRIHFILRKVGSDGSNIHGFWKAAPQGPDYGPDFSKAFDITYKQATGEDPLISPALTEDLNRERYNELVAHRKNVIAAYNETNELTPEDTVKALVDEDGYDLAMIEIAEAVNASGDWDRRLYPETREWAKNVAGAASHEELENNKLFDFSSWIHSSHLNQIAQAAMKFKGEPKDESLTEGAEGDTYTFSRKCQLDPDLPDSGGYKVTLEDKEHGISFNVYWYKRSGYAASNADYLDLKCDDPKIGELLFDALSNFEASPNCFTELKRDIDSCLPAGSKVKYGPTETVQNPTIVRYSKNGYRYEYPNPHYIEKKDESLKEDTKEPQGLTWREIWDLVRGCKDCHTKLDQLEMIARLLYGRGYKNITFDTPEDALAYAMEMQEAMFGWYDPTVDEYNDILQTLRYMGKPTNESLKEAQVG